MTLYVGIVIMLKLRENTHTIKII